MKSLGAKVTMSIILCSLISSIIILCLSTVSSLDDSQTELIDKCESAGGDINSITKMIEQSVDTVSDIVLQDLDLDRFRTDSAYVDSYTQSLMDSFMTFAEHTEGAICAYVRYNPDFTEPTSGIFLTRPDTNSEFESVTPTDFSIYDKDDVAHVGWYYLPVENGAPIWMAPYLNENVNIYMISYVVPIYVGGVSVGIVGMDIDFARLIGYTDELEIYDSGYAFIIDQNGGVQNHPSIPSGTALGDYEDGNFTDIASFVADSINQGEIMEYSFDKTSKYLVFYELDSGMKLVLTAPVSETNSDAKMNALKMATAIAAGLIISVFFSILIGRGISIPIKKITEIVNKTSTLDFKSTQDSDKLLNQKDEIGSMARAVEELRSELRNFVTEINGIHDHMKENMKSLSKVMSENSALSEDNSATTEELAAGMEETTANSEKIIENIETIKNNVIGIRTLSKNGSVESVKIRDRAKNLRETTVNSSNHALEIYESMKKKTSDAVERSKVVSKINELTENIREISSQTNLLALNANIEAARAGEAGRGFAVVATEIGNLANQTFSTVDGINEIVEEVNESVNSLTDCIRVIMEFLESSVAGDYVFFKEVGEKYEDDATGFADSMSKIYDEICELNEKVENITLAINHVGDTINQSTDGINLIAEKSAEAVNRTQEGCLHLEENEEGLQHLTELIYRFKI